MLWTDLQAFLVFALGDLLVTGMLLYLVISFFLGLTLITGWAIRNVRP